jgi:sn-glycerol 3-phosphate transport system substrate-binding protein
MRIQPYARTAFLAVVAAGWISVAQAAPVEIQWWHAMTGALNERVTEMVERYNKSQNDVKVVATFKGSYPETINQTIAAFRAKKQPHMVQVFEVGTLTMMTSGAIYPVYQLMKDQGHNIDWSKFVQPVLSYYVTADNNLLSMPFNSSTPIFYYNKDQLAKAGLTAPPKTWNEVTDYINKLKASGQECAYTTSWQSWVHVENFSALHQIPFASEANGFKGLDAELKFNNPQILKHITRIQGWAKSGAFSYQGRTNEGSAAFYGGKCSMLTESSAGYANVTKNAKFNWGATTLPTETGATNTNSIIGGATLWVLTGHSKEDYGAVAKFLNFIASTDNQVWWHQQTGYVPITLAAYAKSKADGYYKKVPVQEIALTQLTRAKPTDISRGLRLGNFVQIRTVIDEELENVWNAKKTPQQGLDDAVRRGNQLLREFEQLNKQR